MLVLRPSALAKWKTLIISSNEAKDVMKIVKSLEISVLSIKKKNSDIIKNKANTKSRVS